MNRFLLALVVSSFLFSGLGEALAAPWERLVMPGEVISGHAKYEEQCQRCHPKLEKTTQRRLCLDCHEKIDHDITERKGYHGHHRKARDDDCRTCHTEHKGRDADVVLFDADNFDHRLTDFELKGSHLRLPCRRCHKAEKPYRQAPSRCFDCHQNDDAHDRKLGKKCQKCQDQKRWSRARFDHDKTDFKLRGKHKKARCESCHTGNRYKNVSTRCHDCHRLDDAHAGNWGRKCQKCHDSTKWKSARFDHDKTKFKLRGRHRKTACYDCHPPAKKLKAAGKKCHACHEKDDEHNGRYGNKCQRCHNLDRWSKQRFDHSRTDFPLEGRHEKIACRACHRNNIDEKTPTRCHACHEQDDIHEGKEGRQCQRCHDSSGWRKRVVFDHDISRFPLIGLHAIAPCEACHLSGNFRAARSDCNACHREEDEHQRRLGTQCGRCHTPNGWELWQFDHDRQSDYPLTGKHKGLDCLACHTRPAGEKVTLSRACRHCHAADDIHRGQFGPYCDRCHTTASFEELTLGTRKRPETRGPR